MRRNSSENGTFVSIDDVGLVEQEIEQAETQHTVLIIRCAGSEFADNNASEGIAEFSERFFSC